jgi:non-specific serine/threonine protein kinase/serine/threonine-protein kinase
MGQTGMNHPSDDDRTRVETTDVPTGRSGTAAQDSETLARIGSYRPIQRLGRGGMGSVWLAEQLEPVRRKVAVKLIHGSHLTALDRALFEVERQTLARMSHPFVAQVFDAGKTDDGRPWFAMEWVAGDPISDYCDQRGLSQRERARLFARVCLGVHHAHQRGIIHRDLKPANVLVRAVDGEHLPKIIDFGVATSVTGEGDQRRATSADRVGTRAYMSPEQQDGDAGKLDTRSDVYALGVMLFELLSGERPPDAADSGTLHTFHAALGQRNATAAGNADADSAPLLAAAALDREMRCILARALAPDRDDRYASADEFAGDLQHWLSGEPVAAVPATRAYRCRKFLSRHRLAIGASSIAAFAVATGLVLAVWGLLQAQAERDRAQLAALRAEQSAAFVSGILSSVDPVYASGQDTTLLRRALDEASERAGRELEDQPVILAEISSTIGSAYKGIGEDRAAVEHFERAAALSADRPDQRRLNLHARIQLAELQGSLGRADEGLAQSTGLLEVARRELLPIDPLRLQIASVHGYLLQQEERLDEAEQALLPVIRTTASMDDPEVFETRLDSLRLLAQLHSDRMQLEDALATFDEVLATLDGRDDSVATLHRALTLADKAVVFLRQQRYADAEPLLRESLALNTKIYGRDHPMTRSVVSNLGGSLRQQGRPAEALPFYREAHAGFLDQYGIRNPRTVIAQYNLGNCYRDLGRPEQAVALQREALQVAEEVMPENRFAIGNLHLGLGRSELAADNPAEAMRLLSIADDMLSRTAGEDHYRSVEARDYLVRARNALGEQ